MSTIDTFAEDLHGYLAPEQVAQVVRAYDFAEEAHEGQTRKSGEPYINHPLAVAQILADMRVDHQCLMLPIPPHDIVWDARAADRNSDQNRRDGGVRQPRDCGTLAVQNER